MKWVWKKHDCFQPGKRRPKEPSRAVPRQLVTVPAFCRAFCLHRPRHRTRQGSLGSAAPLHAKSPRPALLVKTCVRSWRYVALLHGAMCINASWEQTVETSDLILEVMTRGSGREGGSDAGRTISWQENYSERFDAAERVCLHDTNSLVLLPKHLL